LPEDEDLLELEAQAASIDIGDPGDKVEDDPAV